MTKTEYPDYLPQEVIEEFRLAVKKDDPATVEVMRRLIFRPCMEKVFRRMDRYFSERTIIFGSHHISLWAWFVREASATDDFEWIRDRVKPARAEAKKRIERIRRYSRQLIEDLNWMCAGVIGGPNHHGLDVPDSFYIAEIIEQISGDANEWNVGTATSDPTLGRIPHKMTPETHYVRGLVEMLLSVAQDPDSGFPSPETIGQRFVLSYDDLARVTRAALDLPDSLGPYRKAFSGEDVRRAIENTPQDSDM